MAINNLNSGVGIQPTIVDAKGDLIVATGADAVNRLAVGTANQQLVVDSSTSTGLKWAAPAGLVLLNTTSFSGVSSQSVNDVFSATYTNYRIVLNVTSNTSGAADIVLRMRIAGADNSTAGNYRWSGVYAGSNATTVAGVNSGGGESGFRFSGITNEGYASIDLYNPFESFRTGFTGLSSYIDSTPISYSFFRCGVMTVTTSYTGFTFFPAVAGNITGTVSIFGYNK
jgi:hypothetical protein